MANDGGLAFPIATSEWRDVVHGGMEGMSLRDWFAGHATEEDVKHWLNIMEVNKIPVSRQAAKYLYANAMIAERDKEAPNG